LDQIGTTAPGRARAGRPADAVAARAPSLDDDVCAVGIDVGATKIAAAVVAFPSAEISHRRLLATAPDRGGLPVLEDVVALSRDLGEHVRRSGLPYAGIGVGVAELVSTDEEVQSDFLIEWSGLPVVERLGGRTHAVLDADIRMAALSEARLGAGRDLDSFAYLNIGTGIGFVFVRDAEPWPGARGSAGTLGYNKLHWHCRACGSASLLTVEEIASGRGLVAEFARRGGRAARAEEVFAAVAAGDPLAVGVVRCAGEMLGAAVAGAVDLLDPEAIVLGGGLGLAGGLYRTVLEETVRQSIWSDTNRSLALVDAVFGTDAGVVGAACRAVVRRSSGWRS
jgi:glucokinase